MGHVRTRFAVVTYRAIAATIAVTVVNACTDGAPDLEWSIVVDTLPSGTVQVTNVLPESGVHPVWSIEAELTIGSVGGLGPEAFGQIKGVAPLTDGRIAVLDAQVQEVRVFSPDGEHLQTFGGRGAGPGELNGANGLLAGEDGILRVHDPTNSRLSFFHPDSGFLGSQRIDISGFGYIWNAGIGASDNIYEPTRASIDGEPWHVVRIFDAQGLWADTILVAPFELASSDAPAEAWVVQAGTTRMFIGIPFWPQQAEALDPEGFFWTKRADENEYRFVRTTLDGDTLLVFESRRPPVMVSTAQRDAAIERARETSGGAELDWARIPSERPLVERAFVDNRSRLWVRVTTADGDVTYDLFDREGQFQGTAVTGLRVSPWPDPVVIDDWFYAVSFDDLGVQYVVRARINEASK